MPYGGQQVLQKRASGNMKTEDLANLAEDDDYSNARFEANHDWF
jgi:hypothetical protein